MNHQDAHSLLAWYTENKRELPWRESRELYPVLVSEFMLQQTTVAAVVPKFKAWMKRFPDVFSLAEAEPEEVLSYWSGLGYYQRAKRLHNAAKELSSKQTEVNSYDSLLALPGFGPYTAAAVASICFESAELAVDTNVIRVLYRYYALKKQAQDKLVHRSLRDEMSQVLAKNDPGEVNQAIMELGATLCSVKEPACLLCPLKKGCQARIMAGGPSSYPLPKVKKQPKRTSVRAYIISQAESGEVLLVKGTPAGLLKDLYQPPLFFHDVMTEVSHHAALKNALDMLSEQTTENLGQLKYGISGRRLEITCSAISLSAKLFASVKRVFLADLEVGVWQGASPSPGVPVSTLTRKVMSRWQESL